jgi:hypothetical protein
VSFDFLDRRSAERFAELLDETNGGRRHHSHDRADEELAELVAIGHSLSASRSSVQVDTEFRVGLRAMLVATAERDGIGATATAVEAEPGGGHAAVREPRRSFFGRSGARRIRARGAIVIGVAAGAMAVSGISAASENAAPGDALYGVKRSTEKAQLAMAGSDVTRGQLSLDFARTRLAEAAAMPGDDATISGVLADMDADTRQGVKLLTGAAVAEEDTAPLTRVDGFVAGQRQTLEPMLEGLSPANRESAETSMALLEKVDSRAGALRAGLACGSVSPVATDVLGPEVKDCVTGANDHSSDSDEPAGQGEKAGSKSSGSTTEDSTEKKPAAGDPTADPATTGRATQADDDSPATPDVDPTTGEPTPAQTAPADPGDDPDKGVLDGILGGIFG